jgi:hypothetical protein
MKYLKYTIYILLGTFMLTFIGVKQHTKENLRLVFLKTKPSLKVFFKSPIGDSPIQFEDLTPEEKIQEQAYQTVAKQNQRTIKDKLAILLFQVGIYTIVSSLLQLFFFRLKYRVRWRRVLTIQMLGAFLALGLSEVYWTKDIDWQMVVAVQVLMNMSFIFPFLRKNTK